MKTMTQNTKRRQWMTVVATSLLVGTLSFSSFSFAQPGNGEIRDRIRDRVEQIRDRVRDRNNNRRDRGDRGNRGDRGGRNDVPELNSGLLGMGLLLTAGGVLVMTGRQRRKDQSA